MVRCCCAVGVLEDFGDAEEPALGMAAATGATADSFSVVRARKALLPGVVDIQQHALQARRGLKPPAAGVPCSSNCFPGPDRHRAASSVSWKPRFSLRPRARKIFVKGSFEHSSSGSPHKTHNRNWVGVRMHAFDWCERARGLWGGVWAACDVCPVVRTVGPVGRGTEGVLRSTAVQ